MDDTAYLQPPSRPLVPDERGYFGRFGGTYVPEILMPALVELDSAARSVMVDPTFWRAYMAELRHFSGRPTPITPLPRLSARYGGAQFFLKREDLCQTGAHKVNNVIGQGLLCRRLGKTRVIAETGAGQHGVATATMAARLGLKATIYMGAEDVERQRPNVFWMEKLGAQVVAVEDGARTLKDAINAAMRDWATHFADTHYLLGTACGPHPFPMLVAWLQSVVGLEARQQMVRDWGGLPDRVYACVGGGSNALGIFQGFLAGEPLLGHVLPGFLNAQDRVECVGAEAQGKGTSPGQHAARLASGQGTLGIAQGYESYFLQTGDGQMIDTHSVAAGLDYVGVSPLVAHLYDTQQIRITGATDEEVIEVHQELMKTEGIIAALESTHGVAAAVREGAFLPKTTKILINLSGRGDKDIFTIASALGDPDGSWGRFLAKKAQESVAPK